VVLLRIDSYDIYDQACTHWESVCRGVRGYHRDPSMISYACVTGDEEVALELDIVKDELNKVFVDGRPAGTQVLIPAH
jgi:hypothetical protein